MRDRKKNTRQREVGREKYEIKKWDITSPASLKPLIKKINQIIVQILA